MEQSKNNSNEIPKTFSDKLKKVVGIGTVAVAGALSSAPVSAQYNTVNDSYSSTGYGSSYDSTDDSYGENNYNSSSTSYGSPYGSTDDSYGKNNYNSSSTGYGSSYDSTDNSYGKNNYNSSPEAYGSPDYSIVSGYGATYSNSALRSVQPSEEGSIYSEGVHGSQEILNEKIKELLKKKGFDSFRVIISKKESGEQLVSFSFLTVPVTVDAITLNNKYKLEEFVSENLVQVLEK